MQQSNQEADRSIDAGEIDTARTSTWSGMPRGRPRILPDAVPRINEIVVLDEMLKECKPRSAKSVLQEKRKAELKQKQEAKAREMATQKEKNRLKQLLVCVNKQQETVNAELQREAQRQQKLQTENEQLAQLKVALEAGDISSDTMEKLSPRLRKGLELSKRVKKPRLTDEEKYYVRKLRTEHTEREIASEVGCAPSTVHYVLTHLDAGKENHRGNSGRHNKLTEEMLWAIARYRLLFNQEPKEQIVKFVKKAFGVEICSKTIDRHLTKLGFRVGDFKRYPRDRNSERAIHERFKFASEISKMMGELSLHKAIYSDEFSIVEVFGRKAWSINGWFPCVTEYEKLDGKHITAMVVASPELGLIYWQLCEGSIKGENIRDFYAEAMKRYCAKSWVRTKAIHGVDVPLVDYDLGDKRLFLIDNASQHHRSIISNYFKSEVELPEGLKHVSDYVELQYLPIYSPFFNPLEEAFSLCKFKIFKAIKETKTSHVSRTVVKKIISEELSKLTKDELHAFQQHQTEFIRMALEKQQIFSQSHYEDSHFGDEVGCTANMQKKVDELVKMYLPESFDGNTAVANSLLHKIFDKDMITPDDLTEYRTYV